jgi:hypothetical protein
MLFSRTVARKRIAAGVRPTRRAAWLLVLADGVIIGLLLAALWMPAVTVTYVMHMSLIWTILFLMVVIYLPAQIVVIISSLWAAKSRWEEEDPQ